MKKKRMPLKAILVFTILLNILFFQNCSKSAFISRTSNIDLSSTNSEGASQDPDPVQPSNPNNPNPGNPNPNDPNAKTFLLYVAKSGMGTVTSLPAGIDCGNDCSEAFDANTSVTLIAVASDGASFQGWSGACSGLNPTCTVKMSALRNLNVNFESTSAVGSIDMLIASMPSNSWKSLPNTQMKVACPAPYSAYFCESVISAWSGGAYDEKRDRMIIIGGGHADSWYNNVFAFDLGSMQWSRLNEMPANSGSKPPEHWNDMRVETCGFYPKAPLTIPADFMKGNYVDITKCDQEPLVSQLDFQQPRSTHSYQRVFVDRIQDRYCYILLGTYPSAQAATNVAICLNPATGLWERMANHPANTVGRGQTALDSQGHVWAISDGGGNIAEYNPMTNSWSTYGYVNYEAGGTTDIDRKRNHMYVMYPMGSGGPTYSLRKFDLNSSASLNKRPAYTEVAASGDLPKALGDRPGFVYADNKDLFYAWGGGRDILTFDPATGIWKKIAASGDDPGVQQTWGTYGRFRYSPKRGVFVVVNSSTRNVFVYKP